MSLLRRAVIVSSRPQVHDAARAVAHEVFMADDLAEASDIVHMVTPDLIVFDESSSPARVGEWLREADNDRGPTPVAIVLLSEEAPFAGEEYERAGISHCLQGDGQCARLCEIAVRIHEAGQPKVAEPGADGWFLDETAAAVGMVGRSEALRKTLAMIGRVARSRCNPILIVGETGTGKELAARAVHVIRHADQPFVAVNCAALTANLLESELFGHVKGAFTGADREKIGLFEVAGEGTLLLDEISEMPLDLQAKLLRVLQERTFRKVGGVADLTCRATIIASSNRNLKKEVQEKRFRQDLYYRLDICPIALAPLRSPQRREDIALLAEHFLRMSNICGQAETSVKGITKLAREALRRHPWPGNVRELRNVIERALLLETTDKIGLQSILLETSEIEETAGEPVIGKIRDFSLETAERELIARALQETGWQKTQAASLLGITRATLYAKVKQYNLQRHQAPHGDVEPATFQPGLPAPAIAT